MKLYTKTGDDGSTGLLGGRRVPKNHGRVDAYGEVDELNAVLGWCAIQLESPIADHVRDIQSTLFSVGAVLACDPSRPTSSAGVDFDETIISQMERWIDQACDALPALTTFILPGGTEAASRLHLARTVCRRAERAVVRLAGEEAGFPSIIVRCLNRLSDLLFAWARLANHRQNHPDIPWKPAFSKP